MPEAYALAFTALEEIAKSQLAADVYTGYISKDEFDKSYTDHRRKIKLVGWATKDAEQYLSSADGEYLELGAPTFEKRNESMYVNLRGDKVSSPSNLIDRGKAEGIIHTVNVALWQIVQMTDFWGHQIGTKGFMK